MGAAAVAACFASPVLTHVLGLGCAFLMQSVKTYPAPFVFDIDLPILQLSWIVLFACLLCSVIVFSVASTSPPKTFGYFLLVVYIGYIITTLVSN